ncbi:hypothetical protein [Rhodococcus jostii]|uniref:hypothetical protein n=1 Tax=Rhodococcus jostii TaxID=132919 RepID=UPI003645B2E7
MVNILLRTARAKPRVRIEVVRREDFTDSQRDELHALSNALAAEDAAHFAVHAASNEVVHIFRRIDTGQIVGFQFWTTRPVDLPRSRMIVGGKLRVLPEFRNRGVHLLSGLAFYLQQQIRHPCTRYYRLSLASMFGFVSLTQALAEYHLFDVAQGGDEAEAIRKATLSWAGENHLVHREDSGVFFVDIFITEETFAQYSARFFEKKTARAYAAANPSYRRNGCYIAFWFRFGSRNILALVRTVARKLWA